MSADKSNMWRLSQGAEDGEAAVFIRDPSGPRFSDSRDRLNFTDEWYRATLADGQKICDLMNAEAGTRLVLERALSALVANGAPNCEAAKEIRAILEPSPIRDRR